MEARKFRKKYAKKFTVKRQLGKAKRSGGLQTKWLSIYEWQQQYGGPEEGGWYYDTRELLRSIKIRTVKYQPYAGSRLLDRPYNKREQRRMDMFIDDCGKYGRYHYEGGTDYEIETRKGQNQYTGRPFYE